MSSRKGKPQNRAEAELTKAIVRLATTRFGYKVMHIGDSRQQRGGKWVGDKGTAGWPDLTLAKPGRFLVMELKCEKNKPTANQWAWLQMLAMADVEAYLIYDRHWHDGLVDDILAHEPLAQTPAAQATAVIANPLDFV